MDVFPIRMMIEERNKPLSVDELKYVSDIDYYVGNTFYISQDDYVLNKKRLSSIKRFIEKSLDKYMKDVLYSSAKLRITNSWINIEHKGMSHPKHNHANSFLSGVFYFTDVRESPLVVYNPSSFSRAWDYNPKSFNAVNSYRWTVPMNKNSCVIFPSTLEHSVDTHNDEKIRISLSFNSFFDSSIGSNEQRTTLTF